MTKYRMSFTTGGLFLRESEIVNELYNEVKNWKIVRERLIQENLLQLRTESSRKRISREVCARLTQLNDEERDILDDGSGLEKKAVLWVAVCRHYRFIREFAVEVIRNRFLTFQYELGHDDFDAFFNAKAAWDEGLESKTEQTRYKLRQVLFKILREADILSECNMISQFIPTPRVAKLLAGSSMDEMSVFPVQEFEIERLLNG